MLLMVSLRLAQRPTLSPPPPPTESHKLSNRKSHFFLEMFTKCSLETHPNPGQFESDVRNLQACQFQTCGAELGYAHAICAKGQTVSGLNLGLATIVHQRRS